MQQGGKNYLRYFCINTLRSMSKVTSYFSPVHLIQSNNPNNTPKMAAKVKTYKLSTHVNLKMFNSYYRVWNRIFGMNFFCKTHVYYCFFR